jgi:hypothetical protein
VPTPAPLEPTLRSSAQEVRHPLKAEPQPAAGRRKGWPDVAMPRRSFTNLGHARYLTMGVETRLS